MLRRVGVTALGDVVDDHRDVTVAHLAYPLMVITGVEAPASARPGEQIEIRVSWRNDGGDGTRWTYTYDLDTGEVIYERSERAILAGQSGTSVLVPFMPNRAFRIRFQIGHVEL